ncbi:MAG TPA: condensation domain-containing protein, partial [Solirubrobacteraceae bacterium]|nr:condensation domain-containing protein [Solirubrobacteraceae bacterium]
MAVSPRSVSAPVEAEASIGQRLLWLLDHYRGGEGTINVPIGWRIRRPLDVAALGVALERLVERHETLRTTYRSRGRRLIQLIHGERPPELRVIDVSGEAAPEPFALAAMDREVRTDMDPALTPLTVTLWRIAAEDHLLLINLHHLATDFFSNMILTRDLGWLYDHVAGATAEPPPPLPWSYADWSAWQGQAFAAGRQAQLQAFWREALEGSRGVELPRAADRPGGHGAPRNEKETLDLDPAAVEGLRETARGLRTTMFGVMLA